MNEDIRQNQEIIHRILDLLPTIQEALQHMQVQLTELRLEESATLFQDTAAAIGSITNGVLPMINQDSEQHLVKSLADLRQAISMVTDAYEQNNLTIVQTRLTNHLIPAYTFWQQEILQLLRPVGMS